MTKYIIFALVIVLISCNNKSDIPIISNANIEIDGLFTEGDWNNSRTIALTSNNILYLAQSGDYLFLGIKNDENVGRYVDLYLENEAIGIVNLHASMALGERELSDNWNDTIPAWNWGNNTHWTANIIEVISEDEEIPFLESVKPYQGHEFRISKKKIRDTKVKIRFEIKDFVGEANDIIFPIKSARSNSEKWLKVELE